MTAIEFLLFAVAFAFTFGLFCGLGLVVMWKLLDRWVG